MLCLFYEGWRVYSYIAPETESLKSMSQNVVQFFYSIKFRAKCSQLLRAVTKRFVARPLEKIEDLILKADASSKVILPFPSLYSVTGKHRNTKFQPQDTDNSARPFLRQSFWEDPLGHTYCECVSIYLTLCYRLTSETFMFSSGEHYL